MPSRSLIRATQDAQELFDSVAISHVRQTVNAGPVDSDGRADFLEAGSGLQVVSKEITSSLPLQITFGDGFKDSSTKDVNISVKENLEWNDLPDDEADISLFIRWDGEEVTTFHQVLSPEYNLTRPSSPSEGQTWYATDHRGRMEIYESGAWNDDDLIICVGQCSTNSGGVVDVRSYAYQGKYSTDFSSVGSNAGNLTTFVHNIGSSVETVYIKAVYMKFISSQNGFDVGDVLPVFMAYMSATVVRGFSFNVGDKNTCQTVLHDPQINHRNKAGTSAVNTNFNNLEFKIQVERAF